MSVLLNQQQPPRMLDDLGDEVEMDEDQLQVDSPLKPPHKEEEGEEDAEALRKRDEFATRMRTLAATLLFFLVTGVTPTVVIYFQRDNIMNVIHFIQSKKMLGALYYVMILIVWTVVCMPTTIMELACGFIFGFKISVGISLFGKSVGSILSFMAGRYCLKKNIQENLISKYPVMIAVEKAVAEKPYTIILLTRICVLPMAVKNYGMSIMEGIPMVPFSACVFVGGLPFTLAWSYFGSASSDMVSIASGGHGMTRTQKAMKTTLLAIGVAASVVFLIAMKHFTKKQMEKLEADQKKADENKQDKSIQQLEITEPETKAVEDAVEV